MILYYNGLYQRVSAGPCPFRLDQIPAAETHTAAAWQHIYIR